MSGDLSPSGVDWNAVAADFREEGRRLDADTAARKAATESQEPSVGARPLSAVETVKLLGDLAVPAVSFNGLVSWLEETENVARRLGPLVTQEDVAIVAARVQVAARVAKLLAGRRA